jgi:cbb3-type cytochrome oxidase maturation protein
MSVIFLLIPLSIVIAACFLGAFIWAVRTGQYEDTLTPSMRVLLDDALHNAGGDARPQTPRSVEKTISSSNHS